MQQGTFGIQNPLSRSTLNSKGLCDYVINVARGCLHGCTFCYVPSTPVIRTRPELAQQEWGKYLMLPEQLPERLDQILTCKREWTMTSSGKEVVLLCSGTDPYQNKATAQITRQVIGVLLKHNKRVRILTRSPLVVIDEGVLNHRNITTGFSLPYLDDDLSR